MTRQRRQELILDAVRALRARWLAVCLCLAAGVIGGVFGSYRAAYGFDAAIVDWHGLEPTQIDGIGPVRWMTRVATMKMVAPDWRPLTVRLDVIAQEDAGTISVEADGWPVGSFHPAPGRSTQTFSWRQIPDKREKLLLRVFHDRAAPVGLVSVTVFPRITLAGRFRHASGGFVTGVLLAALYLLIRMPRAAAPGAAPAGVGASTSASAGTGFGRRAAVAALVAAYLAPWALIKPVLQAPDEPQHLMKANAVRRQPWLTAAAQFEHDPRFLNPLALWHPPALGRVFYNGDASLSAADIDLLEHVPWPTDEQRAVAGIYRVALASYPTLYYWSTFAISQPIIAFAHASPYQAIFIYRAATVLLASIIWAAVYVELRRTSDLRRHTNVLMVFMLANPMLAFISSSVNTDAFAIPLCIGGAIACWRVFTTGHDSVRTIVWLTAASLVKPAGIQMIAALAVTVLLVWLWFEDEEGDAVGVHAPATLLTLARAGAISAAAFYSWSYIHLYATEPMRVGIGYYAGTSLRFIPDYWVSYWGRLGWLDYSLPVVFYTWMLLIVAWCARDAWRAPLLSRAAQTYWVICFIAYAGTLFAIEYLYLHEAGFFLQGRYFLPASIGLGAWLLMHRGTVARATLLSSVMALNVLLFGLTVQRYYAGDWNLVWRALPFVASDAPSPEAVSTKAAKLVAAEATR